jgi:hypothetical protein
VKIRAPESPLQIWESLLYPSYRTVFRLSVGVPNPAVDTLVLQQLPESGKLDNAETDDHDTDCTDKDNR